MDRAVEQYLGHRIRAHQAALAMAARLEWPAVLAHQVIATRAALAECQGFLAVVAGTDAWQAEAEAEAAFWAPHETRSHGASRTPS